MENKSFLFTETYSTKETGLKQEVEDMDEDEIHIR